MDSSTYGKFHLWSISPMVNSTYGKFHRESSTYEQFHLWTIPPMVNSTYGQFHLWTIPPMDNSTHGHFHLWTIPPKDNSTYGQFHLWKIPPMEIQWNNYLKYENGMSILLFKIWKRNVPKTSRGWIFFLRLVDRVRNMLASTAYFAIVSSVFCMHQNTFVFQKWSNLHESCAVA